MGVETSNTHNKQYYRSPKLYRSPRNKFTKGSPWINKPQLLNQSLNMEDPFYRTLNRVRVLEDDLRVEVDRKIKLESRSNVIAYELDYNKKKCTRVLPDIRSA